MDDMTSRERVLRAIEHKEPDRVPINFAGTLCTSIVESIPNGRIYTKLGQYLGFDDPPAPVIADVLNVVCNVDERIQKKFGSDIRVVYPNMGPAKIQEDGTRIWESFGGVKIRRMGYYDEFVDYPMKDVTDVKAIKSWPFWPDTKRSIYTKGKREEAKKLHEETNYAITADSFFSVLPYNVYMFLTGMDRWLIDMKVNEKFYFALSDKLLEIGTELNAKYFKEVGDYIDIAMVYDDLGSQENTFMSPSDYRKFVKPYMKQVIENIKKYTDAKILIHCDGAVHDIIKDFIELGIDAFHPAQPGGKNMEPWRLKKEFGKDITFVTGIDIQTMLPFETPEGVKKAVKEMIEVLAPGGGFIISPTHNIEPDTPPENIVAAYEAAKEYGNYQI
jgi:uroporphyrinogen decarboxylase